VTIGRPHLTSLAAKPAGKLNILRLDCDALSVDCCEVGVCEEAGKIILGGDLKRGACVRCNFDPFFNFLGNLVGEAGEGVLVDN
jgi:hypothetical protein